MSWLTGYRAYSHSIMSWRCDFPPPPTTLRHPSLHVVNPQGFERLRASTFDLRSPCQRFDNFKEISLKDTRPFSAGSRRHAILTTGKLRIGANMSAASHAASSRFELINDSKVLVAERGDWMAKFESQAQ